MKKLLQAENRTLLALLVISVTVSVAFLGWMASNVNAVSCAMTNLQQTLPKEYVSMERYNADRTRMESQLTRIEDGIKELNRK